MEIKRIILPAFLAWGPIRFCLFVVMLLFIPGAQDTGAFLMILAFGATGLVLPAMAALSLFFPERFRFAPQLMALGSLAGLFPLGLYFLGLLLSLLRSETTLMISQAGLVIPFIIFSVDLLFIPVLLSLRKEE